MSTELKLKSLTVKEIAKATGGITETVGHGTQTPVTHIGHDSRDIKNGELFCAIRGDNFDGHDYIKKALEGGAVAVLCERMPPEVASGYDYTAIVVEDTVRALGALASYYKTLTDVTLIAITGSVGKTTTKEFIYSVCSSERKTHKTRGNFNNEIGLPMMLFELEPSDRISVLEMGMSNLGEISRMSKIAKPDIAVITNIGTSHMATLGSRENICRAKLEILDGMNKDGCIFINGDEPLLSSQKDKTGIKTYTFGVSNRENDIRAMNIRIGETSVTYDMIFGTKVFTNIEIPTLGKHNVLNSLVAFAVGTYLGIDGKKIERGLSKFEIVGSRQKIYDVGKVTVIDDCYNASPESMRAGIDVLMSYAAKTQKTPTALLGDMLELGEDSRLMHDQIGKYAAKQKIQKLFCFGAMADAIAEAAIIGGIRAEKVFVCADTTKPNIMADMMFEALDEGDVLYVKASRGVAAERVLAELEGKYGKK